MSWETKIFAYCERGVDASFWAEPVNAISNLAFIVAAVLGFAMWRELPDRASRQVELVLVLIVFAIGIGSFLFHTLATRWAALADVAPITIFMVVYLGYAVRRFVGLGVVATAVCVILFAALLPAAGLLTARVGSGFFAGSASYLPALGVLAIISGWLLVRGHPAGPLILGGAVVFAISLALRTYDMALCHWADGLGMPALGTHFAWHVLNGLLLYLLLRAALRFGGRATG